MALKGVYGKPYINLDSFINIDQFNELVNEMIIGISKSWVDKGVVSCGVRPEEKKLELCHVLKNPEKYLNAEQVESLNALPNLHQKAWYCTLLLPIHHPYSLVFLRRENQFWNKHLQGECKWTENAPHFPKTIEFIKRLPFKEIGRILFFVSEPHQDVLIHYDGELDGSRERKNTEMIYFRPMMKKNFFLWDNEKNENVMVKSCASYWNDLDWHGALPSDGKAFSLRVDGIFEDSFRETLKGS